MRVCPLAGERAMYVQNGNPARLKVISEATGKTELEFSCRSAWLVLNCGSC